MEFFLPWVPVERAASAANAKNILAILNFAVDIFFKKSFFSSEMLLCVNVRKGGVRLFYAFSQASENRPEDGEGGWSEGPGGRDDAFFKSRRK